jgi:diaminopropionate ammonia-lyase
MIIDPAMTGWKPERTALRHLANSRLQAAAPGYPAELRAILSRAEGLAALAEIETWPGYRPTPLHDLPGLARRLGLGRLLYKDEGGRFGLGSFKALGGAYAVYRYVAEAVRAKRGRLPTAAALIAGEDRDIAQSLTVATATDGNHGRSVAWGASLFGARAVIYIHATVSEGRRAAIEAFGAEVRRVAGNYDDSVHRCAAETAEAGWQVISDTSYGDYVDVPRQVMQGYCVMAEETVRQLAGTRPTHVFVQAGCGGLAATVIAYFWETWGASRPRLIVVEPERADCVYRSIEADSQIQVTGDLKTIMAGLACGEVSGIAWQILRRATSDALAIPDSAAVSAMRMLAEGIGGDAPVVGGESGVGGLAGLLAASGEPPIRDRLGLDESAQVLLIGSESDTDPALYRQIVGRSAGEVRAT